MSVFVFATDLSGEITGKALHSVIVIVYSIKIRVGTSILSISGHFCPLLKVKFFFQGQIKNLFHQKQNKCCANSLRRFDSIFLKTHFYSNIEVQYFYLTIKLAILFNTNC